MDSMTIWISSDKYAFLVLEFPAFDGIPILDDSPPALVNQRWWLNHWIHLVQPPNLMVDYHLPYWKSGWWARATPLKNMSSSIGMMTATQYFWENKKWQPNHQPEMACFCWFKHLELPWSDARKFFYAFLCSDLASPRDLAVRSLEDRGPFHRVYEGLFPSKMDMFSSKIWIVIMQNGDLTIKNWHSTIKNEDWTWLNHQKWRCDHQSRA